MAYSETIILPEFFYELFAPSEAPQGFENFGIFGSDVCIEPVGIHKPEGIPDLLPYQPKRNPNTKPNEPNSQNTFQPSQNSQKGGRGKQQFQRGGRRQQQPYQPPGHKKIVTTVEVAPEYENISIGSWAKPKVSPPVSAVPTAPAFQSESIKLGSSFNPEKAPSVSSHASEPIYQHSSSSSFNPESISTSSDAPPVPKETPKPEIQPPAPAQENPTVSAWGKPQSVQASSKPAVSAWGNNIAKPKPQSFAQLLQNEESAKPATRSPQKPAFNPSTIVKKEIRPFQPAPADDDEFPSFASLNKQKK